MALLVFALGGAVYLNTLGNGFVFDDREIIERNPSLRSPEGIPGLFFSPYWSGEGRTNRLYRPLTLATYALNRAVTGETPWGFHLVNLLLHGATAALLLLLLLRLFRLPSLALAASALFAVHSVLTEAVAGLVGRAEILSALFLLAALLLDRAGGRRRALSAGGSLVCFFLALLSKENALAYPGLLLLTDFLLGPPEGVSRRRRAGEILGVILAASLYLLLRMKVLGSVMEIAAIPEVDNLLAAVPAWRRILTALALSGRYAGLFLMPVRLSADYSARQIEPVEGLLDPAVWIGIALWAGVGIVLLKFRHRLLPAAWGLGFAAVSFILVSNIPFPIGTIFAERLLYLPLAGLCATAGFVASSVAQKRPRVTTAAAVAVLALLSARTWSRNRDWRDDFSLFQSAAVASPASARVRYNLGNAYRRRGDLPRAEENYRECLRLVPGFDAARRNLGVVLSGMGRGEEALGLFREALAKNPSSASLHNNLGNAYRSLGRNDEAEAEYSRALALDPESADAHNNLGVIFHERGDSERAEAEYREAIRLDPGRIPFRINLGNFLLQQGDPVAAERVFREAVARDPSLADPHRGLGEAQLGLGDFHRARSELELSLALDPSQWEAPALLGYLCQRQGDAKSAIRHYQESLSRNPAQPELEQNLGILYASTPGGKEEALEHLRRCLALNPSPEMESRVRAFVEGLEGKGETAPGKR